MMTSVQIPTPPQLDADPELAVLAALEAALKASVFALITAHPALRDADCRVDDDTPDSYWVASVFLTLADQLGEAINAYRRGLDRRRAASSGGGDFPF
jgi:hypothetical protein